MRKEIDKAVETFHRIALRTRKQGNKVVPEGKLASFVTILTELLITRYEKNWYPSNPNRGSGYRCLRINGQCIDPTVVEGLKRAEIALTTLGRTELTIWVDPGVVSVRIGEEGSIGSEIIDEEVFRLTTTRPRAPSEDEAYSSRSPSPAKTPERPMSVSPPLHLPAQSNQSTPSTDYSPRSFTPSPQVSYMRHPQQNRRISPPRLMNKGLHLSSSSSSPSAQHLTPRGNISSGHIPSSRSPFNPARALFPAQDNTNGSYRDVHLHEGVVNANYLARRSMQMHMANGLMHQGTFHDIPIPAMA